jgi:hypothetical protein
VLPFVGMPRQSNSSDCGVMVAASMEWILSQFLTGQKFPWDASGSGPAPAQFLLCASLLLLIT